METLKYKIQQKIEPLISRAITGSNPVTQMSGVRRGIRGWFNTRELIRLYGVADYKITSTFINPDPNANVSLDGAIEDTLSQVRGIYNAGGLEGYIKAIPKKDILFSI